MSDPIHVKLLVETALGDSKDFQIFPQEEIEEIKRECQVLTKQMEQTRHALAIKCKYHETSLSITRLSRDMSLESRLSKDLIQSHDTRVDEDDLNLDVIQRECEELAVKLFHLERQLMTPQNKLQRHTAGILQLALNEIQNSKEIFSDTENMYPFNLSNKSPEMIGEEFLFDERSLYSELEILSGNTVNDGGIVRSQADKIEIAEKKLIDLNRMLRQLVCNMVSEHESQPSPLPSSNSNSDSLDMLKTHLEFMEQCIVVLDQEQGTAKKKYDMILFQNDELVGQKNILRGQIEQQQEQMSTVNAKREIELEEKSKELAQMTALQAKTKEEAYSLQKQVDFYEAKLDEATKKEALNKQLLEKQISDGLRQADENALEAKKKVQEAEKNVQLANKRYLEAEENSRLARSNLEIRDQEIIKLKEVLQRIEDSRTIINAELQVDLNESKTKIKSLSEELASATSEKLLLDAAIKEKDTILARKENEIDKAQMDIARLQTEVTIAKAELEGAYGSRAQRAAEVAANPAIQKELDRLASINSSLASEIASIKSQGTEVVTVNNEENVKQLKKELAELIEEYELMTKASIEWEKEREQLEKAIDDLRCMKEDVETQLSEEKLRWLGMQGLGTEPFSPNSGSISTTILKNEFKKMIREIRAENMKLLKV